MSPSVNKVRVKPVLAAGGGPTQYWAGGHNVTVMNMLAIPARVGDSHRIM